MGKMTAATMLMKEIDALPEEYVADVSANSMPKKTKVKSMFGAFPGISTDVERDEEDRV